MEGSELESKNTSFIEPINPSLCSEESGQQEDQDKDINEIEGEGFLKIN